MQCATHCSHLSSHLARYVSQGAKNRPTCARETDEWGPPAPYDHSLGGPQEGKVRSPPCPRREGPLSGFSIPSRTKRLRSSVMAGEVHGLAAPPHKPPQRHLRHHHGTFVQT